MKIAMGSLNPEEETFPMEILDYWDEIEILAKQYPGMDIVEVIRKWLAANPGKVC